MKAIPIDNKNDTVPIEVENLIKLNNHEHVLKYAHHFFCGTEFFSRKLCIITEYCEVKHILNYVFFFINRLNLFKNLISV